MFDIPSQENVAEVIVDISSVKGNSQPVLVRSEDTADKTKSNKTSAA